MSVKGAAAPLDWKVCSICKVIITHRFDLSVVRRPVNSIADHLGRDRLHKALYDAVLLFGSKEQVVFSILGCLVLHDEVLVALQDCIARKDAHCLDPCAALVDSGSARRSAGGDQLRQDIGRLVIVRGGLEGRIGDVEILGLDLPEDPVLGVKGRVRPVVLIHHGEGDVEVCPLACVENLVEVFEPLHTPAQVLNVMRERMLADRGQLFDLPAGWARKRAAERTG